MTKTCERLVNSRDEPMTSTGGLSNAVIGAVTRGWQKDICLASGARLALGNGSSTRGPTLSFEIRSRDSTVETTVSS